LHRFILNAPKGIEVDHVNHDPLDCRKKNLRIATHAENMANRGHAHKNSKSGVRGVYWHGGKRGWRVQVRVNKRSHHIGLFADLAEAEAAAIEARQRLHGEFAS
jgi:hypothetical protein